MQSRPTTGDQKFRRFSCVYPSEKIHSLFVAPVTSGVQSGEFLINPLGGI
jgi:hypothetical protein